MRKVIYIFSGLGADKRIFHRLDFSEYSTIFIKWEIPMGKETIENYTKRLLNQITTSKPILIGLSFGGIIAVEVAKLIETEKVILIASAKTKYEIPFYYRFPGKLRLHRLLPTKILKTSSELTNWLFGVSSVVDKELLEKIILDTSPTFLKWAIDKVVRWSNLTPTENVFHIHGTNDRILPLKFVNCDIPIKNGGHLMILNKSDELNKTIQQLIDKKIIP